IIAEADTSVSPKSHTRKPDKSQAALMTGEEATRIPPLESLTGFLLRCASNIADASYYKHVGNAEITPRQLAILLSLRNGGQMTQVTLSVVPCPPGGQVDASARVIADEISRSLLVPVVVENRAGAGGVTGSASVARA